jgi:hypothetical protein
MPPAGVGHIGFLWWQLQRAPGGLAAGPVLAHPPGGGKLVHDEQAQPAVGLLPGHQQPQQLRVLIVHRHMQPSAAQLHPQFHGGAGVHPEESDQLAGQQRRRVGQPL